MATLCANAATLFHDFSAFTDVSHCTTIHHRIPDAAQQTGTDQQEAHLATPHAGQNVSFAESTPLCKCCCCTRRQWLPGRSHLGPLSMQVARPGASADGLREEGRQDAGAVQAHRPHQPHGSAPVRICWCASCTNCNGPFLVSLLEAYHIHEPSVIAAHYLDWLVTPYIPS